MFKRLAITVTSVLLMVSTPLFAADFRVCEDCHLSRLEHDRGQDYQHQAFAGNQCSSCHMAHQDAAVDPLSFESAARQRVSWVTESPLPATSHWFLLPAEGLRETLVVGVRDHQGQVVRTEVPLPQLELLESAADNGRAPQLANVRVVEVKRGVFLTVTIAWQTDMPAAAEVYYGTAELNQRVDSSGRLGYEHQLILQQLQPNKTYRYQVVSRDLSGRESLSPPLTFSTARALPRQKDDEPVFGNSQNAAAVVAFRRRGDDYLLEVRLDQPRIVCIGSKGGRVEQPREVPVAVGRVEKDPHAGLSDAVWSTLGSCRQCHEKNVAASHPVNVLPRAGMIIPPEYPTLADGRMTCASCHAIHGSDQRWLTRKRSKRELCVGCHQDML